MAYRPNAATAQKPLTTKGEETRSVILAAAVEQASVAGFESLTIGSLAEKTGMSKSGLFAHFGSKLELQVAALDEAARQFTEAVFLPAMKAPRGLKRLRALFENWILWPQSTIRRPRGVMPTAALRVAVIPETVLERLVRPAGALVTQFSGVARRFQHGALQLYVLYVLVGLVAIGTLVFVGTP